MYLSNLEEKIIQAKEYHSSNDLENARLLYQQILEIQPANADILYHSGLLFFQENKFNQAIPYFQKAIQSSPQLAHIHFHLGMSFFKCLQMQEALDAFARTLMLEPGHENAQLYQGEILSNAGQVESAYNVYKALAKNTPGHVGQHNKWFINLALQSCLYASLNKHDHNLSQRYLDFGVKLFKELSGNEKPGVSAFGHYHAGQLLSFMGEKQQALAQFEAAQKSAPQFKASVFQTRLHRYLCENPLENRNGSPTSLMVHIGYPKAASTWLQRTFFPYIQGNHHLGQMYYDILDENDRYIVHYSFPCAAYDKMFTLNEDEYDAPAFVKFFRQHMDFQAKANTVSAEDLVLQPDRLSQRLDQLSADMKVPVKVMMVIRRQSAVLLSEYGQRIKAGTLQGERFDQVLDWDGVTDEGPLLCVKNYHYIDTYKTFCRRLGEENVLVLPFETLFSVASLRKIFDFMGVPCSTEYLQFLLQSPVSNKTSDSQKDHIAKLNPDIEQTTKKIDDYFQDTNKRLEEALNIDLTSLGYCS